jgi:Flp pilus assembly protein TadD
MIVSGQIERRKPVLAAVLALALATLVATPATSVAAGLFSRASSQSNEGSTPRNAKVDALAAAISQALDERRYVDAGALLDQAVAQNVNSPEITRLTGDLLLARGRYADALTVFRGLAAVPAEKARGLEGEGLALSLLGRSSEALTDLKQATALDKTLWRAWNDLGAEYDGLRDWKNAQAAYAKALEAPGANTAIVLNNRGYSRLLQRQTDAAAADFVAALQKDPSLAEARTNLRLTLGIEGHYGRAAMTGVGDDRAAVLNNVGVAAAMRGDYVSAEKMLNEAIAARGQFYGRAAENLQISHELAARTEDATTEADAVP